MEVGLAAGVRDSAVMVSWKESWLISPCVVKLFLMLVWTVGLFLCGTVLLSFAIQLTPVQERPISVGQLGRGFCQVLRALENVWRPFSQLCRDG